MFNTCTSNTHDTSTLYRCQYTFTEVRNLIHNKILLSTKMCGTLKLIQTIPVPLPVTYQCILGDILRKCHQANTSQYTKPIKMSLSDIYAEIYHKQKCVPPHHQIMVITSRLCIFCQNILWKYYYLYMLYTVSLTHTQLHVLANTTLRRIQISF